MGSFDDFARRARKKSEYAKKMKAKREAANKAAIPKDAIQDTGFNANLSAAQKWSKQNPDMAKYDNDGNPVTGEHWGW